MSGPCIICYEPFSECILEEGDIPSENRKELLKRFYKLLGRHLDLHKSVGDENGDYQSINRQSVSIDKLIDAGVSTCGRCSKVVESFCEVYHQMKSMELMLNCKIRTLAEIMSGTHEVPERVTNLRDCVNKLASEVEEGPSSSSLTPDLDLILKLNSKLVKSCQQKVQHTFPKVRLSRLRHQEETEPQTTPVLTRNDPEFFRLLRLIHIHGWPKELEDDVPSHSPSKRHQKYAPEAASTSCLDDDKIDSNIPTIPSHADQNSRSCDASESEESMSATAPVPHNAVISPIDVDKDMESSNNDHDGSDYLAESDNESDDLSDKEMDDISTGHSPKTTKPRNHLCNICGKVFSRVYHLNRHFKTVHKATSTRGKRSHPCNICGRVFAKMSRLERHLKTVHKQIADIDTKKTPNKDESLRMNDQAFNTEDANADLPEPSPQSADKIELVRLENVATEDVQESSCILVTPAGPSEVNAKKRLRGSILPNPKTLKFHCTLCPKILRDEYTFQEHFNSLHLHHRYKCSLCNKLFHQKRSYRRHKEIVHKGTRFRCPRCSKLFTLKTGLQLHQRTTKCGAEGEGKPLEMHQCHICSMEFRRAQGLQVHIRDVHEKVQDHLCPNCGRGFSRLFALQRHVRIVHEESKDKEEGSKEVKCE